MKVVNNLIFNSLVCRRSINLPEIGSLRVEHHAARLKGQKRLEIPVTRIVYSKNPTEDAVSVIDLIEAESGADRAKAEQLYHKWLDDVRAERVVTIDGTGRIKNDFFTPSPELAAIVNPDARQYVKLDKRVSVGVVAAILVPLVCVICGFYYLMFIERVFDYGYQWNRSVATTPVPQVVVPVAPIVIVADSDSVAVVKVDSATVKSEARAKASADEIPMAKLVETSTIDMYHVIAGVYSTMENANLYIDESRMYADTLPYRILPISNGKFLISVFQSETEAAANKRRAELRKGDPNVWIFKVPAGFKANVK